MNRIAYSLIMTFAALTVCLCLPAASQSSVESLPVQTTITQLAEQADTTILPVDTAAFDTPFTEPNGLFTVSIPEDWQTNGVGASDAKHVLPIHTAGPTTIAWWFAGFAGEAGGQIAIARWRGAIEDDEDLEAWSRQRGAEVLTERIETTSSQAAGLETVAYMNHYPEANHTLMQTDIRCGHRVWLVAYGYTRERNETLLSIYRQVVESFRPLCPTPIESIMAMAPYNEERGQFSIDFPSGWLVGDTPRPQDNSTAVWQFLRDFVDGAQSITIGLHSLPAGAGETLEEFSNRQSTSEIQSEILLAESGVINGLESFTRVAHLPDLARITMQTEILCGDRVWFLWSSSPSEQMEAYRAAFDGVVAGFQPVCPLP